MHRLLNGMTNKFGFLITLPCDFDQSSLRTFKLLKYHKDAPM